MWSHMTLRNKDNAPARSVFRLSDCHQCHELHKKTSFFIEQQKNPIDFLIFYAISQLVDDTGQTTKTKFIRISCVAHSVAIFWC